MARNSYGSLTLATERQRDADAWHCRFYPDGFDLSCVESCGAAESKTFCSRRRIGVEDYGYAGGRETVGTLVHAGAKREAGGEGTAGMVGEHGRALLAEGASRVSGAMCLKSTK